MNQAALAYIQAAAPLTNTSLAAQGLPPEGAKYNSNYYVYRDNFVVPLETLGTMKRTINIFARDEGSGASQNVKLPTTLSLVFFNFIIEIFVDFQPDPALDYTTDPLKAQFLQNAVNIWLQATRLIVTTNQSGKLDVDLASFANFQVPSVLTGLKGQSSNAPFAISPAAFPQYDKRCLELSPPIVWPSVANLKMQLITDVEGWYNDAQRTIEPSVPFDPTFGPYAIKLAPIISYKCKGVQVRTNM